jgi:hypothetical protein
LTLAVLTQVATAQLPLIKHRRLPGAATPMYQDLLPMLAPGNGAVNVDLTAGHALNKFSPAAAFGAGVDAIGAGGAPTLFTTANMTAMLGAGHGSLSYRLYTELNVQDWHWNPAGTWSGTNQGYFVGSTTLGASIQHSYGYFLPHRGTTFDQGDNQKYSVVDDGNLSTYWKSNPYLTSAYTHEADTLHPQWLLFILPQIYYVNAVQIRWANPFAVQYQVQYWTGDDPMYDPTNGKWVTFPSGSVTAGQGGTTTLKIASTPIAVQFVRILMTQSSNTYDTHGTSDARNKMGYAIYEAGIGQVNSHGAFTDYVTHSADQNQTTVFASSNDPWHASSSQNQDTEQAGLDFILGGKLAQRAPTMVPVPMLYSTPDNAAAEIAYLTARKYPLLGVELGEEADGQFMLPEDYAALYVQWAAAIRKVNGGIKLGGPVTSYNGVQVWPDASGSTDFLKRFVAYLTSHNALGLLNFISTEHYPFYQATMNWSLVGQEIGQVKSIFTWVASAQVPSTVPIYITEYNLSAAPAEPIVDIVGALWHAAFVGEFLSRGGAGAYYYQYLPYEVSSGGTSYGLIGMLASNDLDQVIAKTSQYFSSQMMNLEWCQPGTGTHSMLPTTTTLVNSGGKEIVLPYTVVRPDGQYSVLLVNTDSVAHTTTVTFSDTKKHYFNGSVTQLTFSSKDYRWFVNGLNSIATPDGPYEKATVPGGSAATYTMPAHSLTVLRGTIL